MRESLMTRQPFRPLFRSFLSLSIALVLLPLLFLPAYSAEPGTLEADYYGKRFGIVTGTAYDVVVEEHFPDSELYYYNSNSDALLALESNKIDVFLADLPVLRYLSSGRSGISCDSRTLEQYDYAYTFAKNEFGQLLCDELSSYIKSLREDGTLKLLESKWLDGCDIPLDIPDYRILPNVNGNITGSVYSGQAPFVLVQDGILAGYEVDLLSMFCREKGYSLVLNDMDWSGCLPSLGTKADVVFCGVAITEERKESVLFSEPDYISGTGLAVRSGELPETIPADDPAAPTATHGFLSRLSASFEKTFLREGRWKLFLRGIGTTMLITVLSILSGTLLGFLLFFLCRSGGPLAKSFTRFSVWLVEGMPTVVFLMILYYVVFANSRLNGIWVSIIGFTATFGCAMYGIISSGVNAISNGQLEAALALGYGKSRAFFRMILPQAAIHFLPAYRSEVVSHIKATAIVGYIAVQDLTKISDIVRSRTYEAFFPLIATAILYFLLAGILTRLVKTVEFHLNPKNRSRDRILRGVKTDD